MAKITRITAQRLLSSGVAELCGFDRTGRFAILYRNDIHEFRMFPASQVES